MVQGSDGHRSCGFSCEMYLNIVSHVSFVKSEFRLKHVKAHDHFPEGCKFNMTAIIFYILLLLLFNRITTSSCKKVYLKENI